MDIISILLNSLAIIAIFVFYYKIKNYWPKYFEQKGTNQATKEDIGEITTIVENIKSDLLQQNEYLKAQLSFTNQHKLNLKNAEREAILDFNRKISAWLYSLIRFTFSPYNIDNYKEMKIMSAEFAKRQYECDLAEAHLVLFMYDEEFLELKKDLIISIIKLEGIIADAIHKIYWEYAKCELQLEGAKNNPTEQSQIRYSLYKELGQIVDAHSKDTMNQFKTVNDHQIKMRELINKRLKQIEEDERKIESSSGVA